MKRKGKNIMVITLGALALIAATAGASVLITHHVLTNDQPSAQANAAPAKTVVAHHENIHWNRQAAAPAKPACNDHNIVGDVVGGVAGGVVGNQVGKGKGNTAATIGGTLGGAYLGNKFIPTDNVTCK